MRSYKMYKLFNSPLQQFVIRLSDNAYIPLAEENKDYQQYLKWVEAGNTPLPADGE